MFEDLHSFEFNVFDKENDKAALLNTLHKFFIYNRLIDEIKLSQDRFRKFLEKIEHWYNQPAYHNFAHVVDVTQCIFLMIYKLEGHLILDPYERFALLMSAVAHDMGHEGLNNDYLIQTQSHLVGSLGQDSPLEKLSFKIFKRLIEDQRDLLFVSWNTQQYNRLLSLTQSSIIATDMKFHQKNLDDFKNYLAQKGADKTDPVFRELLCKIMMKSADISNVFRPLDTSKKWSERVRSEFFNQGDIYKQLNLPVIPMMDRQTSPSMAKGQLGFINFVVAPLMNCLVAGLPTAKPLQEQLESNKAFWEASAKEEDAAAKQPV